VKKLLALVVLTLLLLPLPAAAQQLPARVDAIAQALYDRNKPLAHGNDDQRRALTKMVAEQVTCELGPRWGWKSSTPSNPPSKDAIARHAGDPHSGPLDGWDLFDGSSRKPIRGGIYHDLSKPKRQHFIPVSKVDHLAVGCLTPTPPPDPDPEPEPPPPTDPTALLAILAEVKAINAKLEAYMQADAARDEALRSELKAAIEELNRQVAAGIKIRF
jgi:hypothetical protein